MNARLTVLTLAMALGLCDLAIAQEQGSLNPMHALAKSALANFVELPLFDPARRLPSPELSLPPAAVVVAPALQPSQQPPAIHLVGIIRGQRDLAIVHENGAGKTLILRDGELVDGWTVVVHQLGVTLKKGDRSVNFAIFALAPSATSSFQPEHAAPGGHTARRRQPDL